jgi:lysozyme
MAQIDDATANWIKKFEGYSPKAYGDYKQTSIGYGTRAQPGEKSISREEAHNRLVAEAGKVADYVDSHAPGLDAARRASLISFGYNLGTGYKGLGGIMPDVQRGDWNTVATRMQRYNHAGGQVLDALTQRRAQEAEAMRTGQIPEGAVSPRPAGAGGAAQVAGMAQTGPGQAGQVSPQAAAAGIPQGPYIAPPQDYSAVSNAMMQNAMSGTNAPGTGTTIGKMLQMVAAAGMQHVQHQQQVDYNKKITEALSGAANDPNRLIGAMLSSGDPGMREAAVKTLLTPKQPKAPGQIVTIKNPKTGEDVSAVQHPDGSIQIIDPSQLGVSGGGATRNVPGSAGVGGGSVAGGGGGAATPATPQAAPSSMFAPQGNPAPGRNRAIPEAPEGANVAEWRKAMTEKQAKENAEIADKAQGSIEYLRNAGDIRKQVAGFDPGVFTPGYASDTMRNVGAWVPNLGLTDVDKKIQQRDQLEANINTLAAGFAKSTFGSRVTNTDLETAKKAFGMSPTADQQTALRLLAQREREAHGRIAEGIENGSILPNQLDPQMAKEGLAMGVYKPEWFGLTAEQAKQFQAPAQPAAPSAHPETGQTSGPWNKPAPTTSGQAVQPPPPDGLPTAPAPQVSRETPLPQQAAPWTKQTPDPGAATRPYETAAPKAADVKPDALLSVWDKLSGAPGSNLRGYLDMLPWHEDVKREELAPTKAEPLKPSLQVGDARAYDLPQGAQTPFDPNDPNWWAQHWKQNPLPEGY